MVRLSRAVSLALLGLALAWAPSALARAGGILVYVDGGAVAFEAEPYETAEGALMVPLKTIYERMGASVGYSRQTRTIVATRGSTRVEMALGSILGRVDGQPIYLDAPPIVKDRTTMVPLRFAAESMGFPFGYDQAAQAAHVGAGGGGLPSAALTLMPAEAATVDSRRPTVGAVFGAPVRPSTVRLRVDGRDFTEVATIDSRRVAWEPAYDLSPGRHHVLLEAQDDDGAAFRREWGFTLAYGGEGRLIQSLAVTPSQRLRTGDTLVVTLQGPTGGRASMDVGGRRGLEMREVGSGTYQGTYRVAADDRTSARVTVRLVMPDGRTEEREAAGAVEMNMG